MLETIVKLFGTVYQSVLVQISQEIETIKLCDDFSGGTITNRYRLYIRVCFSYLLYIGPTPPLPLLITRK